MSRELQSILAALAQRPREAAVLATLVSVAGSSYRRPGARLLLLADGTRVGSISGGCLEDDVIARARQVLATGRAETVVYDTTTENDLVWGTGLGCHGVVRVFIEPLAAAPAWAAVVRENLAAGRETELEIVHTGEATGTRLAGWSRGAPAPDLGRDAAGAPHPHKATERASATGGIGIFRERIPPPTRLAIFGAGDDARPLVRFAKELGWHVTVADSRPAYVTAARFPEADELATFREGELGAATALAPRALAVVMTHRYRDDMPLLRALLPQPLAYLGLLGPKQRAERILATLAGEGLALTPEMRARLHAPVGLDLGATTPEAVALAILAEMLARLSAREPIHLRERARPIHD
ncbi:MAG: XdhC family protein [Opitutae bacterium]|nr:XdhC family protein [Opitutae bacterium]